MAFTSVEKIMRFSHPGSVIRLMETNPAPLGMPQKILILGQTNIWRIVRGAGFLTSTVWLESLMGYILDLHPGCWPVTPRMTFFCMFYKECSPPTSNQFTKHFRYLYKRGTVLTYNTSCMDFLVHVRDSPHPTNNLIRYYQSPCFGTWNFWWFCVISWEDSLMVYIYLGSMLST